ncbi:PREDICTED: uncharacterized protein LOC107165649 [Diuraphis noxia]|uniref:uncharacterized protein LOC107165649 n=1 Tax=Diuraphis noxia TaxID=143948 RepID=UPI0007635D60|nr:PREDICTED: uncharacterized protein LOC107165649 [Diuraphis noxia]
MSAYTVYALFAVAVAVVNVTAIYQPDEVGPKGKFDQAVKDMMDHDENMTQDVAEMLVAANSLGDTQAKDDKLDPVAVALQTHRLNRALKTMDEVQRTAADLYDQCYDEFLDLFPAWRMYMFSNDPKHKNKLFNSYCSILTRYNIKQEELLQNLGVLVALEKTLLPSNVYPDPDRRIEPSSDTAAVLENF